MVAYRDNMDKFDVIEKMKATRVVPVFYNKDVAVAKAVAKACFDGGVRCFEFTNRGDFAQEVFAELVKWARQECPELAIGVGSVVDAPTAAMFMQMGAAFVVGPLFNAEVARVCHRRCVLYIPGCGSVSEVGWAQEAGCDVCKAFPGDVLGPGFVKGLMAPMPWSKIMVTGGVEPTEDNLAAWRKSGAFCVGMGSKLFPKDKVAAADWTYISNKCKESIAWMQ